MVFIEHFDFFYFSKMFEKCSLFFDRSQKFYFSELKKVEYSFNVKNCDLSIADVFRAIRALLLPERASAIPGLCCDTVRH